MLRLKIAIDDVSHKVCDLYHAPQWQSVSVNHLKCLQHRAIRLCMGLRKYDHISNHFRTLASLRLANNIKHEKIPNSQ